MFWGPCCQDPPTLLHQGHPYLRQLRLKTEPYTLNPKQFEVLRGLWSWWLGFRESYYQNPAKTSFDLRLVVLVHPETTMIDFSADSQ